MPTETFFNLTEEKKQKVIKAAKKEFARVPFAETSIKNIVEGAEIARGSFYQYFESKEDLLIYIFNEHALEIDKKVEKILEDTNGDIFEVAIGIYNSFADHFNSELDHKFFNAIFREARINNDISFKAILKDKGRRKEEILKYKNRIDTGKLKIETQEDLDIIIKLLFLTVKMALSKDAQCNNKGESKEQFFKTIEYLKYGIIK